jgi:hypothetical protein
MKKILIKYENLLKRIFTFKIFNSDEIGRTQYLIYLVLMGLTYFTYQYFLDGKPLFSVSVWVRFLLILLFLLIFIFPVVLLKRLKFLYGDKINFKEFYLLGIRSLKINKCSIDTYSLTLLLFILMLSGSITICLYILFFFDGNNVYVFLNLLSVHILDNLNWFIWEIGRLLESSHYRNEIFWWNLNSDEYIARILFFIEKISALVLIYFVYLIFPSGKKNKNQN